MADTSTKKRPENSSKTPVDCYDPAAIKKVTKFLSYVLRHGPDTIGVAMDRNGWVAVDELISRSADQRPLSRSLITYVVSADDKRRFSLSDHGSRIRANHGHSVEVDLELDTRQPPPALFHGTSVYNVDSILRTGLLPLGRNHVHLSADANSAASVRCRPSCQKVLTVDSEAMAADGHPFWLSENGIWLTGPVPPKYLTAVD